jgi:hypothetical protein
MKSGHELYLVLRHNGDVAGSLPLLKNGELRSLLAYLAKKNKRSDTCDLIHGLALVDAAERFLRAKPKGKGKLL